MKLTGRVGHMGEMRGNIGFWCGNSKERDYLGDSGVDGKIILTV